MLNLAIIGAGPAGLSAGLYATRGGIQDVVLFDDGNIGGQITSSSEIENYPGVAQVMSGSEFMAPWTEQAMRFGLKHEVKSVSQIVKKEDGSFRLFFDSKENFVDAKSVIVCTGAKPRKANLKGEEEFFGKGISTCATCDGFFYRNKEVAVLGGGDTALEEAIYLSHLCSKVYVIHRRNEFRAAPVTVEKVKNNPKIELITNALIDEIYGDKMGMNGLKISFKDRDEIRDLQVPGLFIFVGLDARNSVLLQDDGKFLCEMNEQGQALVDLSMKTSLAGLFVAGDLRTNSPRQVICAASDGAIAALSAHAYLESLN